MHAALTSALLVALAEFGDKTQLLALLLASRYRTPVPIILGMLTATALNHALAGGVGGLAAAEAVVREGARPIVIEPTRFIATALC